MAKITWNQTAEDPELGTVSIIPPSYEVAFTGTQNNATQVDVSEPVTRAKFDSITMVAEDEECEMDYVTNCVIPYGCANESGPVEGALPTIAFFNHQDFYDSTLVVGTDDGFAVVEIGEMMFLSAEAFGNLPLGSHVVKIHTDTDLYLSGVLTEVLTFGDMGVQQVAIEGGSGETYSGAELSLPCYLPPSITSMEGMFRNVKGKLEVIAEWDTSNITNMFEAFTDCNDFNAPIGGWDVSNVTDMAGMFLFCQKFNQPIGAWDVSNVTDMDGMFSGSESFNQPIEGWDVSNVTGMSAMFQDALSFNQPLNGWDVRSVEDMSSMFEQAEAFNGRVDQWDVRSVQSFNGMFRYTYEFNRPLEGWEIQPHADFDGMFYAAEKFNQDLSSWCIDEEPYGFDDWTDAWTLPRPQYGGCN